jgi:hypothetical protein
MTTGEHFVFDDHRQIRRPELRTEEFHRRMMLQVHEERQNKLLSGTLNTSNIVTKWNNEYGVHGMSFMEPIPHFSFIRGFHNEPMHLILEGLWKRMLEGTLSTQKGATKKQYHIVHHPSARELLNSRMAQLHVVPGHDKPYKILKGIGGAQSEELFGFLKLYALISMRGIFAVSSDAYKLWKAASYLFNGLLHWRVSVKWMREEYENNLKTFVDLYRSIFGVCNMPCSFHGLQHQRVSFIIIILIILFRLEDN